MGDEREALKGRMGDEREALETNSILDQQRKRKRYHRHTPQQIQQMEAFYKECPHPDEKQRKELSRQLGIEPIQVKFWFQNKRTQMKTQHEHKENSQLRTENERLRAENLRFREALSNACCPNCGVPTSRNPNFQENSCLRQFVSKLAENPTESRWHSTNNEAESEDYRAAVTEVARSAMEELVRIGQLGEPLWVASVDRHTYVLNEEEYFRAFSRVFGPRRDGFKSEVSRESAVVPFAAADVVGILMDVEKWANVFSGVVSQATKLQVVLEGTYNEVMQVMNAEFHVPSPVVPTRESYFVRHCRRHVDATWVVVDVSLDHLHSTPFNTCRRRPSGCLVQDMPNGHSKVIWVEHVEVEEGGGHSMYKPLITAGLAFGARRWVAILDGYCRRVATRLALPSVGYLGNQQGWKSMLKLAETMVTRFCRGVNASIANTWTTISGFGTSSDSVKIMTRKNGDDSSMPLGFHLNIATSFWLPIPPKRIFDFLRNHNTRKEWDMLLNGGDVEEMAHIVSGNEDGNRVTMYQLKGTSSSSNQTIMLQESRKDATASYVVYAPIDVVCANTILSGGDPSCIPLVPSGFAVLPDGPTRGGRMAAQGETGGSLLTVALQILVDSTPDANLSSDSVALAYKIICDIMDKIKLALIT